jgi:hypothetical protein
MATATTEPPLLTPPSPPDEVPRFVPTPSGEAFILATANGDPLEMRLLLLVGPRGTGKTTTTIYAILGLAERLLAEGKGHLLPIRVAVIRDTWTNLERTTIVSFKENQRLGVPMEWKNQDRECLVEFADGPYAHFYFFGLDNKQDSDKLQGFMCGILVIEEAAPAAESTAGIPPEALGIGATSLRQPGIPKRILMPMNPPDSTHWALQVEDHIARAGLDEVLVHRFEMPADEKSEHFRHQASLATSAEEAVRWEQAAKEYDAYRKLNKVFLESIGRQDLVDRLVSGLIGDVSMGELVVPEFRYNTHTADFVPPVPGIVVRRCFDAGATPSTVLYQILGSGDVNIIGSVLSVNKAMGQHIVEKLLPLQNELHLRPPTPGSAFGRGARGGYEFLDYADPATDHPNTQTRSEETVRYTIESMLGTNVIPGPVAWPARRAALKTAFYRPGIGRDRERLVLISRKHCPTLVASLKGKAFYPKDKSGKVNYTVEALKKASGIYFQELDALAYGFAEDMPAEEWLKKQMAEPVPAMPRRARGSWIAR